MKNALCWNTDLMVECGAVQEGDRSVYYYGLEIIIPIVGFTCIALFTGWIIGLTKEVIAYLVAFLPIRSSVGGYHASTMSKCLGISLANITLGIWIGLKSNAVSLIPLILTISYCIVLWLAPVIHPNHPYTKERKTVLIKQARLVGIIANTFIMIIRAFHPQLALIMSIAVFCACLGMPVAVLNGQVAKCTNQ